MVKLAILLMVLGASVSAPAVDLTGCNMAQEKVSKLNRRLTDWSAQWEKFSAAFEKWSRECTAADPLSPEFGVVERDRRNLNSGAGALKTAGEGLRSELAKAKADSDCSVTIAKASEDMKQVVERLVAAKTLLGRRCQEPPPAPAD